METSLEINIEDALSRTRKIMEESKAITMKNIQRKNMLEEKFKFNNIKQENDFSSLNNSDIIRRVSEIDIRHHQETPNKILEDSLKIEELQNQIIFLNEKLVDQSLRIKLLENNLVEINLEKLQLLTKVKMMKKENQKESYKIAKRYDLKQEKKNYIKQGKKIDKGNNNGDLTEIEHRISILEEKYKLQVIANQELIDNFKNLQNDESRVIQNDKVNELEDMLIENMVKYKELKDRLDKTESIIALDKTYYSPDISISKKTDALSPKYSARKNKSTKLLKNKSASSKLVAKGMILHKIKRN